MSRPSYIEQATMHRDATGDVLRRAIESGRFHCRICGGRSVAVGEHRSTGAVIALCERHAAQVGGRSSAAPAPPPVVPKCGWCGDKSNGEYPHHTHGRLIQLCAGCARQNRVLSEAGARESQERAQRRADYERDLADRASVMERWGR
jgi:hypothetical protein